MSCFDNIDQFRESHRVLKKDNTTGARGMYSNIWNEYINRFGVATTYYRNGYKLETQDDFIYGEDATEPFLAPMSVNMLVDYQLDSLMLSKFGIENLADLTAVVSIKDYQNIFGIGAEPKAGDVLELTEAGWEASEMPVYSGLASDYNIISDVGDVSGSPVQLVDVDVALSGWAPVKRSVVETVLSHAVPVYTTTTEISTTQYPLTNTLISVTGGLSAGSYLEMPIDGVTYYVPFYTPTTTIELPGVNSLYFEYNIVDLNGGDVNSAGYFPFDYMGESLLMPVYLPATSAEPTPTVVKEADNLEYLEMTTSNLLCKYRDQGYVSSLKIELSALYGAQYIRYPQLYEITEVKYQDFSQPGINFAQGHYVWVIHAKRFDYSFEPGIPSEGPLEKVYDNSFFGQLSTFDNEPTPPKVYEENVEEAGDEIWDYDEKGTDTGPYGYY